MSEQYYRLTLEDAIAKYSSGDITAKGLLHFYILIKCKPGWKLRLEQSRVCSELGIQKSAFYGAISRLREEGSIDWEAPKGIVVSLSTSAVFRECGKESTIAETESTIAETESTIAETESTIAEKNFSKSPSGEAFGDPPNSYQLFINSLSEVERESFLEFGRKRAGQLPKPPELPDRWIAANWEELNQLWLKQLSPSQMPAVNKQKWASDPRRDEWIAQIRQGKPRWIAQGEPALTRDERKAFAEWADASGLIWGAES
ncbi:hypothetical protein H6F78_00355 [Coleofasciculus sp. FACHB-64]|uniref:hypothetical protein n=1 Tax=Cyanophyceae TaxID=3028117 RepID=UPI00168891BC|nr:hypothetical protein [Coleofasciculus sp. FACHB-64]MBD2044097.1 hypothetical protein [Coleofasciculus sp. FACHB-64]